MLWIRIPFMAGAHDTTLCDKFDGDLRQVGAYSPQIKLRGKI
jgi:hypothetical protein